MLKVLLAVGHRQLEDYLKNKLKNEYMFVGIAVHRESIIRQIGQANPDIVVIRETLEGKEDILGIIYDIQLRFPKVRVVFVGGNRNAGDALLSTLVNYGIYDILHGEKILSEEIVRLIREPNMRKDVSYLQPKPKLNEDLNKVSFDAPEGLNPKTRTIVKEVYKEVFVDIDGKKQEVPKEVKEAPELKEKKTEMVWEGKDEIEVFPEEKLPEGKSLEELKELEPKGKSSFFKSKSKDKKKNEDVSIMEKQEDIEKVADMPVVNEPALVPVIKKEENIEKNKTKEQVNVPDENEELVEKMLTSEFPESAEIVQEVVQEKESVFSKFFERSFENQKVNREKQKIITFTGSKQGVGTTSLAFNTAVQLAKQNKVLYVEMNDRTPAVPFWYELSKLSEGIDTALEAIGKERFDKVAAGIVSMRDKKKEPSEMQSAYKKFPDNLDLFLFSKKYTARISEDGEEVPFSYSREFYLYLLFQLEYDYVILDVPSDYRSPVTQQALLYSHRIFYVVTQDVSALSQATYAMNELDKMGIDLSKKAKFLVNKYEKTVLDVKSIKDWLQITSAIPIPIANSEFILANYNGIPFSLYTKKTVWKTVWKNILKEI